MIDPLSLTIPTAGIGKPKRPDYPQRKLLQHSSDHPDDYILELDYSSASKLTECPRSFENYLIHGRELDGNESATSFGNLFHKCEEIRLHHGFSPETRTKQLKLIEEHFINHPTVPGDHRTASRLLQVLQQYEERYAADQWPQKVYRFEGAPMIERSFKLSLCTIPVQQEIPYAAKQLVANCRPEYIDKPALYIRNLHVFYTGRIDVILNEYEQLWVVDHKTSSRGGNEFLEAFRLSLQTRGYVWAGQKLMNIKIIGLIMNALVIAAPTQKVINNTQLDRPTYLYSQDSLVEFEDDMRAIIVQLVNFLTQGYFPQYSRSFKSPCSNCGYRQNCALPRHQRSDDLKQNTFRDVTWNPTHE